MPQLHPLHAIRFASPDGSAPADVSTKIAPPYDVLDEGPKAELLEKDPHNVVAIDLPVTPPKTVGPDAAYTEAGDLYRRWLEEGVLRRDDRIGVYLRAPGLDDVMAVSRAGEVMPPKSTYFYPKLATGLVINPLD